MGDSMASYNAMLVLKTTLRRDEFRYRIDN